MSRARPLLAVGSFALVLALVGAAAIAAEEEDGAKNLPEVLLSRQLLEDANVRVGDVVTLAADKQGTRAARFRVIGSYEPTPNPLRFSARRLEARLHLPDLVTLTLDPLNPLSGESLTAVNLKLRNPDDIAGLGAALTSRIPGVFARSTSGTTNASRVFAVIDRFHWAIAVVTVIGSTAFLLALMVIRTEERRDIIGILRLIGIPTRSILMEVMFEGLLIAVAGAMFGVLVAVVGQGAVNRFFQWRYDTTLTFVRITLPIVFESLAFAIPLGVLAGLAASWTLLRRDVVALIRR